MTSFQRRLCTLPRGTRHYWISEDNKNIAYHGQQNGKKFLQWGKYRESGFDKVDFDCSISGHYDICAVWIRRGNQEYYVCNDQAMLAFDEVKFPAGTLDRKHFASAGRRGERWYWVLDGELLAEGMIDNKHCDQFVFSPDGKRWMYRIRLDDGWYVGVDKNSYGPFDEVAYEAPDLWGPAFQSCFSPDSGKAFFAAKKNECWCLFCEGVWFDAGRRQRIESLTELDESRAEKLAMQEAPTWVCSLDGSRWAAACPVSTEANVLLLDGEYFPKTFERIRLNPSIAEEEFYSGNDAMFSPDGRHYACVVEYHGKSFILHDGTLKETASPELEAANIFWNPDSHRFNYLCYKSDQANQNDENHGASGFCMVLDGKPGPEFLDLAGGLHYSRDGKHTAYVGTSMVGEPRYYDHMMLNGDSVGQFDWIDHHDHIGFVQGNRLYFRVIKELQFRCDVNFFIFGGREMGPYRSIRDSLISPDENRMAICAELITKRKPGRRSKRLQRNIALILDRRQSTVLATGYSQQVFSPDSQHHLWEVEGKKRSQLLLDGQIAFGRSKLIWNIRFTPDSRWIEYVYESKRRLYYRKISVESLLKSGSRNNRAIKSRGI